MEDKLLINDTDFVLYKDISENMDPERVNIHIRDAQFIDLRTFLGPKLYLLLENDFDAVANTFANADLSSLWFGTVYEGVKYYGLKPLLIEYSYARILENVQLNVTRAGVRKFEDEESEEVEQAQINSKAASARSMALAYQNDAVTYLTANPSKYPTYENESTKSTGFNFFKVP